MNKHSDRAGLIAIISLLLILGISIGESWADVQSSWKAAEKAMKKGPAEISIAGQAVINLPKGYGYIPPKEAQALLTAMGNAQQADTQGLLVPLGRKKPDGWFMAISFKNTGYISDEDALSWNHDELLESYKAGVEEGNIARRERGEAEWEVGGWVEKPQYDAQNHRLIWAISLQDKGSDKSGDVSVNYNTLALGREGYIGMNLVTGVKDMETQKPSAKALLAGLKFNKGKQYADFDSSADKTAEYGLAALITGAAAKKLDLFAIIAAFAVKYAKVIAVAAIGLGLLIARRFSREKDVETTFEVRHD